MGKTFSVMTNILRNVVSKQRRRYKEKGFNLDLAYIEPNIIAMGYPAENLESMYRNSCEEVLKFLEENHHDCYKIYNLCQERDYDVSKFHGRVAKYAFEDHNPPTIELILRFCQDVDNWLRANNSNVAVVHCKAGKGRTGTMICCYLLYCRKQNSAEDALLCYDEKRTKDGKGVTIPSQKRYVQYFSRLIRSGLPYERRTLQLYEIRFLEASNNLLQHQGLVNCSIWCLHDAPNAVKVELLQNFPVDFRRTSKLELKSSPLTVIGDIKIELTHKKPKNKLFHFWFNTFFICDEAYADKNTGGYIYTLQKCEIDDAHKDREHKCYSEDFKVQLLFHASVPLQRKQNSASINLCAIESNMRNNQKTLTSPIKGQMQQPLQLNNSGNDSFNPCDRKSSSSPVSIGNTIGGGKVTIRDRSDGICAADRGKEHFVPPNHENNRQIFMANMSTIANSASTSLDVGEHHSIKDQPDKDFNTKSNNIYSSDNLMTAANTSIPFGNLSNLQQSDIVENSSINLPNQHQHHHLHSQHHKHKESDINVSRITDTKVKCHNDWGKGNNAGANDSTTEGIENVSDDENNDDAEDEEEDWESVNISSIDMLIAESNAIMSSASLQRNSSATTTNTTVVTSTKSSSAANINNGVGPESNFSITKLVPQAANNKTHANIEEKLMQTQKQQQKQQQHQQNKDYQQMISGKNLAAKLSLSVNNITPSRPILVCDAANYVMMPGNVKAKDLKSKQQNQHQHQQYHTTEKARAQSANNIENNMSKQRSNNDNNSTSIMLRNDIALNDSVVVVVDDFNNDINRKAPIASNTVLVNEKDNNHFIVAANNNSIESSSNGIFADANTTTAANCGAAAKVAMAACGPKHKKIVLQNLKPRPRRETT